MREFRHGKIKLLNCDCMEYMSGCGENAFDLAIVDPPYGIGMDGGKNYGRPSRPNQYKKSRPPKHESKKWDKEIPCSNYFDTLFYLSENQIIWGANYFVEFLKKSMGWIYWGKFENESDFSDGELAYTSFNMALRSVRIHPFNGTNGGKDRIHPTQKPVALYKWILSKYAKPEQRIFDSHLGSGSSAIAAHYFGCEFVGCEIDTDYFDAAVERFKRETRQVDMFQPK